MAIDDDIAGQFARMGAAVNLSVPIPAEAFEVLLANAGALAAWIACETQWRMAAGPGAVSWLGLDYSAVDVVLRRLKLDDPDGVFLDLQVMEGAALDAFSERT